MFRYLYPVFFKQISINNVNIQNIDIHVLFFYVQMSLNFQVVNV